MNIKCTSPLTPNGGLINALRPLSQMKHLSVVSVVISSVQVILKINDDNTYKHSLLRYISAQNKIIGYAVYVI